MWEKQTTTLKQKETLVLKTNKASTVGQGGDEVHLEDDEAL
jgi:hypothetical protein